MLGLNARSLRSCFGVREAARCPSLEKPCGPRALREPGWPVLLLSICRAPSPDTIRAAAREQMVPLRPELHPGQIAYNLLITQQMLGHFPAQIIFPDCSNPGGGGSCSFIFHRLCLTSTDPTRRERVTSLCVCPRPNSG